MRIGCPVSYQAIQIQPKVLKISTLNVYRFFLSHVQHSMGYFLIPKSAKAVAVEEYKANIIYKIFLCNTEVRSDSRLSVSQVSLPEGEQRETKPSLSI